MLEEPFGAAEPDLILAPTQTGAVIMHAGSHLDPEV